MRETKKICFIASSGGHYEQLLMLKPLMQEFDSFVVTEKTSYGATAKGQKMYYLYQVNRKEKTFILYMLLNALKSLSIFLKERPDVVICTGVLATIPMCLLAKLFGKKLIYIDKQYINGGKKRHRKETPRFRNRNRGVHLRIIQQWRRCPRG